MSYLVLARKYRPRNFEEMVGQSHVVQALSNALNSQRLHHAYLFTGTRGVGKTTVSRILAKSLNCQGADGQGGITATPCGVCQACRDIDSGRFVDYTELDAASNRGVDEVQALLEQAVYKPVQGRFKVFMIDEVHMLTNTAFNAMLKTLEEPPEYLKFVLATTDPQKVPVTVLSRCLQFNLRPMAPATILEHLETILNRESVEADAQSLRLLARAARGSMRDALSLTDQAIAFGSGRLEEAQVRQMLGSVDSTYVLRLLGALAAGEAKTVVQTVDELRLHGLSAAQTLEDMSSHLQRMAVMQLVDSGSGDGLSDDPDQAALLELAEQLPPDETQLLYSICINGLSELGLAPDEYAALTMVLLRLMAFKPEAAQAQKKSLKSHSASAPLKAAPVQPEPVAKQPVSGDLHHESSGLASSTGQVLDQNQQSRDAPAASPQPATRAEIQALPVRSMTRADGANTEGSKTAKVAAPQPVADIAAVPLRNQSSAALDVMSPNMPPTIVPSETGDFWFGLVRSLITSEAITAMARELALGAQLVARDDDQWLLRVERETLNQAGSRDRLRAALETAGHPVMLVVEVGRVSDSPGKRLAAEAAARQLHAEKIVYDDTLVQALMREFEAKIVPGSIRPL